MDPLIAAALIGGGFGMGGGLMQMFGGGGPSDTALNDQRFMNDFAWKQSLRNEELQKDLAYNGLQIRSRDAAAAGLHPLAALGGSMSASPSVAAFVGSDTQSRRNKWDMAADMTDRMGQNISRSILAQKTAEERALAAATLKKLNSESNLADAQALEARKRTMNQVGSPPSMPGMDLSEKYQLVRRPDGSWEWILSPQASQGIMSDPIKMWSTSLENAFAGPETRPFWREVGRYGKKLFTNPFAYAIGQYRSRRKK